MEYHSLLHSPLLFTVFSQVLVALVALKPFKQLFLSSARASLSSYSWQENRYVINNADADVPLCPFGPGKLARLA